MHRLARNTKLTGQRCLKFTSSITLPALPDDMLVQLRQVIVVVTFSAKRNIGVDIITVLAMNPGPVKVTGVSGLIS